MRIALPRLEELFDDAVFLSSLEVVFVWFHMDSEQAGTVWGEFVANVVEGIDGSVFPRFDMKNRPHIVYSLLNGVCLPRYASAIRVIYHFHYNGVHWKFQCPPYDCIILPRPL